MAPNRHPNRSRVLRSLLLPHNETARNPAGPIESSNRRSGESALPLPSNVASLVRAQSRPIGNVRPRSEERADVAGGDIGGEAEHAEAYYQADAVEDYHRAADAELVAHERGEEDGDDGVVVGRSGEEDGFVRAEAHAALQDDGEEVGEGGGDEV